MPAPRRPVDDEGARSMVAAQDGYLGVPPSDPALIQCTLVIPGKHMLPSGLDNPVLLDNLRRTLRVWITQPEPNRFDISANSMLKLQEAVRGINWAIHDLRLASGRLITRFIVQKPLCVDDSALVVVELGARPRVATVEKGPSLGLGPIALDIFCRLSSNIAPSMDKLASIGTGLLMRVNFGHLEVRKRKKGLGSEMSYPSFTDMVQQYSTRGGAGLKTRLHDVHIANKLLQHFTDPTAGILDDLAREVQHRCTVIAHLSNRRLWAEAQPPSAGRAYLSAARLTKPELSPLLNWTMVAPDMAVDWNLQVDASEAVVNIPANLRTFMESIMLEFHDDDSVGKPLSIRPPDLVVRMPQRAKLGVIETLLKTSAILQFRDTPLAIEISVTKAWNGTKTGGKPETWWGVELYGVHWDEAINHIKSGERKVGRAPTSLNIWPGDGMSIETRFVDFVEHVLRVQSAFAKVGF